MLNVFALGAGVVVTDLASGRVLFARSATTPATPASSAKVATAVAALALLGPAARFTTRVVHGRSPGSVILVGGGDPTLAARRVPGSDYPQPATLASLARQTARSLRAHGRRSAQLGYDVSLYTGPPMAPVFITDTATT